MSKTITKKLLYVVVALAMLAMMVPAMAVSVSATTNNGLTMTTANSLGAQVDDSGYNVIGTTVRLTSTGGPADNWTATPVNGYPTATHGAPTATYADFTAYSMTENMLSANLTAGGAALGPVDKKWGTIYSTDISDPGAMALTWNMASLAWEGSTTITDVVTGQFNVTNPPTLNNTHVAQGAVMDWYLIPAGVPIPTFATIGSNESAQVNAAMLALSNPGPSHVIFTGDAHHVTTISDANGAATVGLTATGVEAVQIVVVVSYPNNPQLPVVIESTSFDFYNVEIENVPQVRWAGEKIVLEKYFGPSYNGSWVKFDLQNQNIGALEGITGLQNVVNGSTVWTQVTSGFASVILLGADAGVAHVTAGLYRGNIDVSSLIFNQTFTVYFLKFESLTLGDVQGKRDGHDSGLWTLPSMTIPSNPWDPTGTYNGANNNAVTDLADNTTQTLNVSQDALLRARVRGWFVSSNPTNRLAETIPGTILSKPAGRWILPDDWAALATGTGLHWDIMCNPDGSVGAEDPLGDYYMPPLSSNEVGEADVIGPFSPGLEMMTPTGWMIGNAGWDPRRPINTVVPDGKLNTWDAPMPAAKIEFKILANTDPTAVAGYFKPANKADIYYIMVPDPNLNNHVPIIIYTNPFYETYIPAHEAIPPFNGGEGYEWNTFDTSFGPYMFWEFINQSAPMMPFGDPASKPSYVEVYSDNHGEAMVWLNGNWNLDLSYTKGAVDIRYGTQVGTTTIQATADYPYERLHQPIVSNTDMKTWLWGGRVLGPDGHEYNDLTTGGGPTTRMVLSAGNYGTPVGAYPAQNASSKDKVVWVWVTDRDGQIDGVLGASVRWVLAPTSVSQAEIGPYTGPISLYNEITTNIGLTDGFLTGTNGTFEDSTRTRADSTLRAPTPTEMALFNKFWGTGYTDPNTHIHYAPTSSLNGLDASKFAVAAIDLQDLHTTASSIVTVNAYITSNDFSIVGGTGSNTVLYTTLVDFNAQDPLDDAIRQGDANCDGVVNMGDVTAVERMILGYDKVTTNAILNSDNTVDMGTVVKIERTILGLN